MATIEHINVRGRQYQVCEESQLNLLLRMRGDDAHHDNYDDPLLRKTFNGTEQDAEKGKKDASAWLNTLHTTDTTNKKPIGQIRIDIDGSSVWVLSNVVSYATDVWSQTLYNAHVVYEDGVAIVRPGEDVYTRVSKPLAERESAGDVWYDWKKLAKNSDIASYVNGNFAPLVDGRIPSAYLAGIVDEVEEYASTAAFPVNGSTAKIYIALDTNKQYRWSGTQYVEISASLALGEISSTAFAGDRGKTLETKVGTLESTVSGQSSTITTLGQNVSTLQGNFANLQESVEGDIEDMEEAIEGTAAVVELTDYMTEGSKAGQALPIGAVYTYVGVPIDGVRVYLDNSSYIFSIAKTSNGHPFQFVVFTKRQDAEEFIYTNTYWWNTAPDWVKRSFGEAPATQTYDGQMSKEDKKALDDLITNVSTNYYTKPQVDTALGNKANTTALSNEVTRAQNAETALGNSVTALQTAVGGKVGAIEFVRYETYEELDGEVMPWAGIFVYENKPVPSVVITNDNGSWDLLLRVSVFDGAEVSVSYHHFVSNYGVPANGWLFDDIYSKGVAPAWMLRAFGEAEATTSYSGMMSAADKTKLDSITPGDVTFAEEFASLTAAGGAIRMGDNLMIFEPYSGGDSYVYWAVLRSILYTTAGMGGPAATIENNHFTGQDGNYNYHQLYSTDENFGLTYEQVGQGEYAFVCVNGDDIVIEDGCDVYELDIKIRSTSGTPTITIADEDNIQSLTVATTANFVEYKLDYGTTPLQPGTKIIITEQNGAAMSLQMSVSVKVK